MQRMHPTLRRHQNGASANGANGHHSPHGHHVFRMPSAPTRTEGKLDYHAIFSAFRRRWFLGNLGLGLLFGIPAAIACWTVGTGALCCVRRSCGCRHSTCTRPPGVRARPVPDFDVWKQTVQKRATHPQVISNALKNGASGKAAMIREQEPNEVSWLEKNVVVKSEGTEYLRLQLEGENPDEVATVVQTLAVALEDDINGDLINDRTKRRADLLRKVSEIESVISRKRTEIANIRNEINVDPKMFAHERQYLMREEDRLRADLRELNRLRLDLEFREPGGGVPQIEKIESAVLDQKVKSHDDYKIADKEVLYLEEDVNRKKSYVKTQEDRLSATHPSLVKAKGELWELEEKLEMAVCNREEVETRTREALLNALPGNLKPDVDPEKLMEKKREYLTAEFETIKKENQRSQEEVFDQQKKIDEYTIDVDRLMTEIEEEEKKLKRYESEIEALDFDIANSPELVTISREAKVPHERILKKKIMFTSVAGFGVFGFFVAGIVFLEFRTQRIAHLNQVSEKLNLRVMGAVPLIPSSAANGGSAKKQAKNAIWYSALTEAVDSTRTLLIRGSQVESLKIIMITSAMGSEGKTTMASHLATSLARGGRKILLVDCDLRRPCVHRAFNLGPSDGVCEILRGEAELADCLVHLESPAGLSILPAGRLDQQVLKLLAMDRLHEMLEPIKSQFDFIIIDSSPLLPVTDALLVAQHVDGVILSIRRDVSRIGKVVTACQKLSMLGIPLLGAVTIGLDDQNEYRRKYGYNYYSYGQTPMS
jgi:polysaccharide biosynthesis transport protein